MTSRNSAGRMEMKYVVVIKTKQAGRQKWTSSAEEIKPTPPLSRARKNFSFDAAQDLETVERCQNFLTPPCPANTILSPAARISQL